MKRLVPLFLSLLLLCSSCAVAQTSPDAASTGGTLPVSESISGTESEPRTEPEPETAPTTAPEPVTEADPMTAPVPEAATDGIWVGFSAVSEITITNAEGETLRFQNATVSGTMEILDEDYLYTTPCVFYYLVKESESFTFTSENETLSCSVSWADHFQNFKGTNAREVVFEEKNIRATGDSMTYTITASAGSTNLCYNMIGSGESSASFEQSTDTLTVSGNAAYRVTKTDYFENVDDVLFVLENGGFATVPLSDQDS